MTSPEAQKAVKKLSTLSDADLEVLPGSIAGSGGVEWALARAKNGRRLVIRADSESRAVLDAFEGEATGTAGAHVLVGPTSPRNAAALRSSVEWLRPMTVGLATSAGFGDRLGLATPGHVRALRTVGGAIVPVFAQQSIREMTRTGRSAQQVVDDAMWGAFEAGWTQGFGADADHLKTPEDADLCIRAGFTWFTIDPSAHVNDRADTAGPADLRIAWEALPWDAIEDTPASLRGRYAGRTVDVEGIRVVLDEEAVVRAAVKYGRAVAHVATMYRHIRSAIGSEAFDVEVSVDETDSPTSHAEHIVIAEELRRLGVRWTSLAPRFTGRFEKGVDYIGDAAALEADIVAHAAIARQFGPYKLSLHSGSDKFSIYDVAARHTRGLVHLKTAGTSYLEALRAVARVSPPLFRAVYAFALERYETDKMSYHVSASLERTPRPDTVPDAALIGLLDHFDVRQILHVTFGSVLTARDRDGALVYADAILSLLRSNPDVYGECLERHFVRHLRPFVR